MTRLTLLEANHSLYARYVEEQTAGVRDVLRRLGEDVGRLQSVVSSTRVSLNNASHTCLRVAYKPKCISAQFTSGKDSGSVWSSNTVNYSRE